MNHHTHHHPVDPTLKRRAIHRSKIITGQLVGLTKAIDNEEYCVDLLRQSLSIRRSLESLDALLLENHLSSHVPQQLASKDDRAQSIAELIELYLRANK